MKFLRIFTTLIVLLLLGVDDSRASEISFDKIPMSQTKLDFLTLYKTQWELYGFSWKLKQAVEEAFMEQIENLMWGTVRIQLISNRDNIQEKIQRAAEYKFAKDYDKFLFELESRFGEKLRANILDFYKHQSEAKFELSANPIVQAYLRQDYDRMTNNNRKSVMTRISRELSGKYGTFAISGAGIITGGLMALTQKQLVGATIPVIGWSMLAWSAWDMYFMLSNAEDTIKTKIFESYNAMYFEEVPLIYWDRIEPYVRDAYIFAYESLSESIENSISLSEKPQAKESSQELTNVLDEPDKLIEHYQPAPDALLVISHDTASTDIKPESQSQKTFRIHEGH